MATDTKPKGPEPEAKAPEPEAKAPEAEAKAPEAAPEAPAEPTTTDVVLDVLRELVDYGVAGVDPLKAMALHDRLDRADKRVETASQTG